MPTIPELTKLETISAQADRFTLFEVQELVRKKLLAVETEVWCESKRTKLIESALMRLPLPGFYILEDGEGIWTPLQGGARLSNLLQYMNNEYKSYSPAQELWGKSYKELSLTLRSRLEDTALTFYIIRAPISKGMVAIIRDNIREIN